MTLILADVVWPAVYLEARMFSWWAIGLGLLLEYFFVRSLTKLTGRQCVIADLAMNAASALLGLLLIPLAGIVWELGPGVVLFSQFNIGTFNPGTWAATFVMAVLINAVLESLVLRFSFSQKIDKRLFLWLCAANSVSVGLASASLFVFPLGRNTMDVRKPALVKPAYSSAAEDQVTEKEEGEERGSSGK